MTYDNSYAAPYRNPEELRSIRDQVKAGLHSDPLVGDARDDTVCGLNVTAGWPLPAVITAQYEQLRGKLTVLPGKTYVYPFSTTHITTVTCVDFKKNVSHAAPELRELAEPMARHLADFAAHLSPPRICMGPPILASNAAFIPIIDRTGSLTELRTEALRYCRSTGGALAKASTARGFHATMLRFQAAPTDVDGFVKGFHAAAAAFRPVEATLHEALVTLELKPYMRDAEALGSVRFASVAGHDM